MMKPRLGPSKAGAEVARARKKAAGGFSGALTGKGGGRADTRPVSVPDGSYVIPADVVSALGQGNSAAGQKKLFGAFPESKPLKAARARRANGGSVPIQASDGEFVVSPSDIERIGGGDVAHGHEILDAFVLQARQDHIDHLKNLPSPKGS